MSCGLSSPMMLEWGSKITHTTQERDFWAHFGGPSIAIEVLLEAIYCLKGLPHLWSVDDLLMTLCFLKTPGENLKVSSSRFSLDFRTMMKRVENTLVLIDCALPEVIFDFFFFFFFVTHIP